jgi:Secretion system C-terminal sorting domain
MKKRCIIHIILSCFLCICLSLNSIAQQYNKRDLQLKEWKATESGNSIQLNWTIEKDSTGVLYKVERSSDGVRYDSIGQRTGMGIVNGNYMFPDNDPPANASILYYRLIVTGTGDESKTSAAVTVAKGFTQKEASIFPNPAQNSITVRIYNSSDERMKIRILDMGGRIRVAKDVKLQPGFNSFTVGLEPIEPNTYLIQLFNTKYDIIYQDRFVKIN